MKKQFRSKDPNYGTTVNSLTRPTRRNPFGSFHDTDVIKARFDQEKDYLLNCVDDLDTKHALDAINFEPENISAPLFKFDHVRDQIKGDLDSFRTAITDRYIENGLINYDEIPETPIDMENIDLEENYQKRQDRAKIRLQLLHGHDNYEEEQTMAGGTISDFLGLSQRDRYNDDLTNIMRETDLNVDIVSHKPLRDSHDKFWTKRRKRNLIMQHCVPESAEGVISPGAFEVHGLIAEMDVKNKKKVLEEDLKKRVEARSFNPDRVNEDNFEVRAVTKRLNPQDVKNQNNMSRWSLLEYAKNALTNIKEGFSEMFSRDNTSRAKMRALTEKEAEYMLKHNQSFIRALHRLGIDPNTSDLGRLIKLTVEVEVDKPRQTGLGVVNYDVLKKTTMYVNKGAIDKSQADKWIKIEESTQRFVESSLKNRDEFWKSVLSTDVRGIWANIFRAVSSEVKMNDNTKVNDRTFDRPGMKDLTGEQQRTVQKLIEAYVPKSYEPDGRMPNKKAELSYLQMKNVELSLREMMLGYLQFRANAERVVDPRKKSFEQFILSRNLLPKPVLDVVRPVIQDIEQSVDRLGVENMKQTIERLRANQIRSKQLTNIGKDNTIVANHEDVMRDRPNAINLRQLNNANDKIRKDMKIVDPTKVNNTDRRPKPTHVSHHMIGSRKGKMTYFGNEAEYDLIN